MVTRFRRLGCFALVMGLSMTLGMPGAAEAAPKKGRDDGKALPAPVVPGEKTGQFLLDLGRKKAEQGDLPGAITALTQAHEKIPRDPQALYLRGAVYQKQNRIAEAETDYRAALLLDPRLVDVRAELGAILTDKGENQEAADLLTQAVKEKPDHFEAQYNLGVALEALHRWQEATEAYRHAAQLRPRDAEVRLNLATTLRHGGDINGALSAVREAVQLAPDDAEAHMALGQLLFDAKRADDAVPELQAATRLKPGLQQAWWRLGEAQLKRNKVPEAIAALEQARRIKSSPEVLTDLGLARRAQGQVAEAMADFRGALQQNPRFHTARIHLSATLAATNQCKEALKELAAVPADPAFAESVNRVKARCQYNRDVKKK